MSQFISLNSVKTNKALKKAKGRKKLSKATNLPEMLYWQFSPSIVTDVITGPAHYKYAGEWSVGGVQVRKQFQDPSGAKIESSDQEDLSQHIYMPLLRKPFGKTSSIIFSFVYLPARLKIFNHLL